MRRSELRSFGNGHRKSPGIGRWPVAGGRGRECNVRGEGCSGARGYYVRLTVEMENLRAGVPTPGKGGLGRSYCTFVPYQPDRRWGGDL